jgi:ribosomal protein S12 methylthiotransferase accessory factor
MSEPVKTRSQVREETAAKINALSRAELLKAFAISRVAELTRLDNIGLPVFTCVRALSDTISIHSGKGLEPALSRCGAIMEAIEFEAAEHPQGKFIVARALEVPAEDRLPIEDCFPVRSSTVNDFTQLAWEEMTNIQNGAVKLVPSDLVWMVTRIKHQPLMYVQMGSNGLASGGTNEDAILSGLYEIIERDAWTLNQFLLDNCGVMPSRTPLINLSPRLEAIVRKIEAAGAKLHLFDITSDYRVPVFCAILVDLSGNCAGTLGGYGCHLDAEIAAIRAITECAQARCCYISGARDDMFRRQFLLMKRADQHKLDAMFNDLPLGSPISDYRLIKFDDIRSELRYLLKLMRQHGVNEVFVKSLGVFLDGAAHVVRVFSPQCEPFRFDHWAPGLRCLSYAKRKMAALAEKEPIPGDQPEEEGEAWKKA